MSESIQNILDERVDYELCGKMFDYLAQRYGARFDLSRLAEPHRVVLAVRTAQALIENGGFAFLFSRDLDGDPHFVLTAGAFTAIECRAAEEAFHRAFTLFDEGRPPANIERRVYEYLRGDGSNRAEIDDLFWSVGEEIESQLAEFIRSRRDEFIDLDKVSIVPIQKADAEPSGPKDDGEPRLIDRLEQLPHWSRVALAARCAREVLPLFHCHWPNAQPKHLAAVLRCISIAEESAVAARKMTGIRTAQTNALVAIGTAISVVSGKIRPMEGLPVDGNAALIAANAAKVAYQACVTAGIAYRTSFRPAYEAVGGAVEVAQSVGQKKMTKQFTSYLEYIESAAASGNWTHNTPVPDFVLLYAPSHRKPPKKRPRS